MLALFRELVKLGAISRGGEIRATMNEVDKVARFTWDEVDVFTRALAREITDEGFSPDVIVGILRGGCIPAVHLSHLLKVRACYALSIESTLTDEIRAERQLAPVVRGMASGRLTQKKVLLVDDVTNTGSTLQAAVHYIAQLSPHSIRKAVLLWDTLPPRNMEFVGPTLADYYVQKVHSWVVFPWNE